MTSTFANRRVIAAVSLVLLASALSGCSAGSATESPTSSAPSPTSSYRSTVIVTYGRNLLFPADSKSYTTPRRISGAVGAATKCTFYPLFTTSQGGGISAEVHLLVPVDAVPTAMDAIWQLPGVNATRVTVSQDFAVGPKDNGAVGPVTDCAAASGNFAD